MEYLLPYREVIYQIIQYCYICTQILDWRPQDQGKHGISQHQIWCWMLKKTLLGHIFIRELRKTPQILIKAERYIT